MPTKSNKPWSRSTKVRPKRQSFNSYIEGAVEWAKKNRTTQCNTCGARTTHTAATIEGNNIITTFTCGTGHTTTQTTGENELKRAYNAQYSQGRNRHDTPDRDPIEWAEEKAFGEHFEE